MEIILKMWNGHWGIWFGMLTYNMKVIALKPCHHMKIHSLYLAILGCCNKTHWITAQVYCSLTHDLLMFIFPFIYSHKENWYVIMLQYLIAVPWRYEDSHPQHILEKILRTNLLKSKWCIYFSMWVELQGIHFSYFNQLKHLLWLESLGPRVDLTNLCTCRMQIFKIQHDMPYKNKSTNDCKTNCILNGIPDAFGH